jgi:hypothetical protein
MPTHTYFSPDQLKKSVEKILPTDPGLGEKVVVGTIDNTGAQIVASFKFKDDKWELQAAARHEWGGDTTVGAKVILRWK